MITVITSNFPPFEGGISRHLYNIVCQLPPNEVTVIGLPTPGWETFDAQQEFKITRLPISGSWSPSSPEFKFLAPFYLSELVKTRNPDFILCGQVHHTLMIPAWVIQRIQRIPFGVFVHGLDLLGPQKHSYRWLVNSLVRAAQIVFVNSQKTGTVTINIGIKQEKIHVVNPTVDTNLFGETCPKVIRQRFGLKGKKCILTVGRLVERKGQDMVIRALPEILKKIPEAHYLIVGRGPDEGRLRELVKSLTMESHVTFAGYASDDELGSYYALCDVFAMISREIPEMGDMEGFGIVYLEANLFGKPVVSGRSGGVSDAVIDGQTGLMVDPSDPLDVANAVTRLLLDTALAHRLGEAGRARALEEFSGQSAVQKFRYVLAQRLH